MLAPAPDPMRSLSLQRVGAMQICVLEMNGCLLLRSFRILGQVSFKKVFTFLGMLERVCQLKYSKYDRECLSFHVLVLKRDPLAVCCCYSKQKAAKWFQGSILLWFLLIFFQKSGGQALHNWSSKMKERSAFYLALCLRPTAEMLVLALCRNWCFVGGPTCLEETKTREGVRTNGFARQSEYCL